MESVHHVEHVGLLEVHLPLVVLVVVEVSPDVEAVPPLELDDLVVLVPPVLSDQVDLVLQGEEEQDGLLPRHPGHVHVIHLRGES